MTPSIGGVDPVFSVTLVVLALATSGTLAVVLRLWPSRFALPILLWTGLLIPMAVDQARTRADVATGGLTAIDIVRGGLPWLVILVAVASGRLPRRRIGAVEVLLVLYACWAGLSSVWSIAPVATLLKAASLMGSAVLAIFVAWSRSDEDSISLADVTAVCFGICAVSLAEAAIWPRLAFVYLPFDPTPRLAGVVPSVPPNMIAFVGAFAFIGAMAAPWSSTGFRSVALRVVMAGCGLLVILLSRTRSELAILVVALVPLTAAALRRRPRIVMIGMVALGLAISLAATLESVAFWRFLSRSENLTVISTLTGRTNTWSLALALWQENPIFGLGYYSAHRFGIQFAPGTADISNVDSMWIEALVDTGVLGASILAAAVAYGVWRAFRWRQGALAQGLVIVGCIASFINPSLESVTYTSVLFAIVLIRVGRQRAQPDVSWTGKRVPGGTTTMRPNRDVAASATTFALAHGEAKWGAPKER